MMSPLKIVVLQYNPYLVLKILLLECGSNFFIVTERQAIYVN